MDDLQWKVNTPGLFGQIFDNPGTALLIRPIQAMANLLEGVAIRASQINDPELNSLMCRLALYAVADPTSPDYDREAENKVYEDTRKEQADHE